MNSQQSTGHRLSRRSLLAVGAAAVSLSAEASAAPAKAGRLRRAGAAEAIARQAEALGVQGMLLLRDGEPALSFGDVAAVSRIASIRKSFLSALCGMAAAEGRLDLDATVAQLGIDDYSSLTPAERQATVRQLLQARSGVYLPTAAETPDMRAARPLRGSHPPGSFWYYNNWDFNVLGEIYQRQTGLGVFSAFEHLLARPLGFQDFNPLEHARFAYDRNSPRFPAYNLFLSTRDMARFGQLFLDGGRWNGREIVPAAWVAESTRPVSRSDRERGIMSAYGHLWWADADPTTSGLPSGSYTAWGVGGRFIAVMPPVRTVVAIQPHEVRGQPKALIDTQSGALDELLMRIAAL